MSCSNDDDNTMVTPVGAPELISPEDGTSIVLDPLYNANPALTLVWNHAGYSVSTAVTYNIEAVMHNAEGSFEGAILAAAPTNNRVTTLTVQQLNEVAISAGLTAFEEGQLDLRVVATLGDNANLRMESNPITINVTPYSAVEPVLYLVGQVQSYYGLNGWDNATAIPMRYIGDGTTKLFEAYVKAATGDGFKFIGEQGTWDNGNYGTVGGVQDGNLENSGGSGDIKIAEADGAGLYYIKVDLDEMTYKSVKMDWGIIGSATAGAWASETPMAYDFATNKYTISTSLADGELKFRSANTGNFIYAGESGSEWKFNVGNSDPKVTYNAAAPNFAITAGTYNLELIINFDGTAVVNGL